MSVYNYNRFKPKYYDFGKFEHPAVGKRAPDFRAYDLNGNEVALSDFSGRPVVLEMGSITCPVYAGIVGKMNGLMEKFPQIQFLLLYVREAHPGEVIGPHRSMKEKISRAKETKNAYHENRIILVDGLDGEVHKKYGTFPNSVYIIDEHGILFWFAQWNQPDECEANLERLLRGEAAEDISLSQKPGGVSLSALKKGGWIAVWDFIYAFPKLVWHKFFKKN